MNQSLSSNSASMSDRARSAALHINELTASTSLEVTTSRSAFDVVLWHDVLVDILFDGVDILCILGCVVTQKEVIVSFIVFRFIRWNQNQGSKQTESSFTKPICLSFSKKRRIDFHFVIHDKHAFIFTYSVIEISIRPGSAKSFCRRNLFAVAKEGNHLSVLRSSKFLLLAIS